MISRNFCTAGKAMKNGLSELAKRVPPNQQMQFKDFQAKHADYLARVNKYPDTLPSIDWEFYRRNVREEFVKMIDEFQLKYTSVCDAFDKRDQVDKSKYFVEIDQMKQTIKTEIENYKAESNKRIKVLEVEYARIKALKPYEEMTCEEYSDLLPDKSMFKYNGRPSFWPHTLDEQDFESQIKGGHSHGGGDPSQSGSSGGSNGGSNGGSAKSKTPPATTVSAPVEQAQVKEAKPVESKEPVKKTTPQAAKSEKDDKTPECVEKDEFKPIDPCEVLRQKLEEQEKCAQKEKGQTKKDGSKQKTSKLPDGCGCDENPSFDPCKDETIKSSESQAAKKDKK